MYVQLIKSVESTVMKGIIRIFTKKWEEYCKTLAEQSYQLYQKINKQNSRFLSLKKAKLFQSCKSLFIAARGNKSRTISFCYNFMTFLSIDFIFIGWIGDMWAFCWVFRNGRQSRGSLRGPRSVILIYSKSFRIDSKLLRGGGCYLFVICM